MEMQVCQDYVFAVKALITVAFAAGVFFQPQSNDDNYVDCWNCDDIFKFLAYHWSAVSAKKKGNDSLAKSLLKGYSKAVVWNWSSPLPLTLLP